MNKIKVDQTEVEPEVDTEDEAELKAPCLGLRHLQALLLFLSLVVTTTLQFNVGVAVVAMTQPSTSKHVKHFEWSEAEKSYILSSFYWGSTLTQMVGGYLCKRLGAKCVLFGGVLGSSLLSVATPQAVSSMGWRAFCVIRLLQGLCQGLTLPCVHQHLANWAPLAERTRLGAFSYTGFDCGNVLAMYAAGMLATSRLGWPAISYSAGMLGVVWCLLWLLFGANSAAKSRCLSQVEQRYLTTEQRRSSRQQRELPIPWRGIFTSAPFYALLCARCADTWGLATMQTELPAYLSGVLGLDMAHNAFFSALPFLLMWGMCYVYLTLADVILQRQWLHLTSLRKLYNTWALWMPAILMVILGFVDSGNASWAIILVTLSVGVSSAATIGSELNAIDLSPAHASILMGIISTFTNAVALLTPLVVGLLVRDQSDRTEWQVVFAIAAGVLFVGNLIYLRWGTAETQPWNEHK